MPAHLDWCMCALLDLHHLRRNRVWIRLLQQRMGQTHCLMLSAVWQIILNGSLYQGNLFGPNWHVHLHICVACIAGTLAVNQHWCLWFRVACRGFAHLSALGVVSMMSHYVIVKGVFVGRIGMHKTGCSGERRLVLYVPSSAWAGKRLQYCCFSLYTVHTLDITIT